MASTPATSNINNFEPLSDFVQEGDCDTLLLYLPGFTKEQLRVQLARSGVLKISGTRPLGDNKWSSFHKDFPISANCDTNKITAKFEDGILYVRQPKLIVPAADHKITPPPQTPQTAAATKTNHDEPHKTTPADKPVPNKENEKPAKDHERENGESSAGAKKQDDTPPEKTGKRENVSGKAGAEPENKETDNSKYRNDIAKLLDAHYKLDSVSPTARLKVARQKMTVVVVVLFAFGLGICINKLQAWFSREA